MITSTDFARLQPLIVDAGVDGWLVFDFRGRNPIAAAVLGPEVVGSRRVYVLFPPAGAPVALVHAVDAELWRDWPDAWPKRVWVTREELSTELGALIRGKRLAVDWSPGGAIPYLDGVPLGVAEQLRALGATLVPSAELVTRYCSVWSAADRASHHRAAEAIASIAREALALAGTRASGEDPITEHALAVWVRERFDRAGLVSESGPSVSWGPNAARAHYHPTADESAPIVRGALLLLDLWATEPGGIYADQTWMAAIGAPSERDARLWTVVRSARDAALDLIRSRVRSGAPVRGAEADAAARQVIRSAGLAERTIARTGHSIDRYGLHGFGPPIDDTETFDDRLLIPGVGFSVEPGVYLAGDAGVRSEVNVVVGERDIEVTPRDPQVDLPVV
ncbi:MAG TPA: M24 family metallopeptidase [Gemmatimonadales bacterium]|jgi:Xaa-Pro aminopeptidase|nr:M24 family metallopeptidase [Gemmatimonadales bacterium]